MKISRSIMFAVALAALTAEVVLAATPPPGAPAPDFVLKSVGGSGGNIRLSEYRGEIVILTFWAAWCGDCRRHLQNLEDVHLRYRDAGLELLVVSLDQDRRGTAGVPESFSGQYPVLHDAGGEVGRLYDVETMPTLVLIDRTGIVRDVFAGYERSDEQRYLARVRDLLREF